MANPPGTGPSSPAPAYVAGAAHSPLTPPTRIYGPIGSEADSRRLREELVIPVRSGRAWTVPAKSVCRFTKHEGPEVLDVNLWHRDDPRERFWAERTRQFHGAHVGAGARLWSTLPFPPATCHRRGGLPGLRARRRWRRLPRPARHPMCPLRQPAPRRHGI
ncbi:DUF1989 domain-containing protein [Streptomyces shenzhenensis]|uniref:DUF1989 domain-containing protein n=1 Tax=Streptomyces shenzhenensis TaxID=943815 RepID=UPI0033D7004D